MSGDLDRLLEDVSLARLTSLKVGGPARYFVRCTSETLDPWIDRARREQWPCLVLGGGSNLLIADAGFPGLVIQLEGDGLETEFDDTQVCLRADAGLEWDRLVAWSVEEGLSGLECLSGIPGRVGAAPMQNIGAYGQEVSETLRRVGVVDRRDGTHRWISAEACGLGYRQSHFKHSWKGRYIVTRVEFVLERHGHGTVRYAELARRLGASTGTSRPTVREVRDAVLELRRQKSMVLDPDDPNRRSAGSFFVNPVVDRDLAVDVRRRARELGIDEGMPFHPTPSGEVKLSAAWLIERAGFARGYKHGRAGLSSRHTLALINRGGATASDLLDLASAIRSQVRDCWRVTLQPEPVFVGFGRPAPQLLDEISGREA